MRNFSVFLLILVGFTTLESCSRDEEDNANLIVGRWQVTQTTVSLVGETQTEPADPEFPEFFTFNADGTVEYDGYDSQIVNGQEVMIPERTTGTYMVSPDGQRLTLSEIVSDEMETFTLEELTSTTLRISYKFEGIGADISFRRVD